MSVGPGAVPSARRCVSAPCISSLAVFVLLWVLASRSTQTQNPESTATNVTKVNAHDNTRWKDATLVVEGGALPSPVPTTATPPSTTHPNLPSVASSGTHIRSSSGPFRKAMQWLEEHQATGCVNTSLQTVVRIGRGGGFGSMFQRVATLVLYVIGDGRVAVPAGHYRLYTRNTKCSELARGAQVASHARIDGGTCFFDATFSCAVRKGAPSMDALPRRPKEKSAPAGALRGFSVVVNNSVPQQFAEYGRGFWWGVVQAYLFRLNPRMRARLTHIKTTLGIGPRGPDIAAHIRLGDKQGDGASRQGDTHTTTAQKIAQYIHEIEKLTVAASADRISDERVVIYVATDSIDAVAQVRRWASNRDDVRMVALDTQTQNMSGDAVEIRRALEELDDAYGPAEEVVIDVALMMEARYFVGICMSQLARMVVTVGKAAGTLDRAVAMDPQNIALRDSMKLGEDEGWVPCSSCT